MQQALGGNTQATLKRVIFYVTIYRGTKISLPEWVIDIYYFFYDRNFCHNSEMVYCSDYLSLSCKLMAHHYIFTIDHIRVVVQELCHWTFSLIFNRRQYLVCLFHRVDIEANDWSNSRWYHVHPLALFHKTGVLDYYYWS